MKIMVTNYPFMTYISKTCDLGRQSPWEALSTCKL